MIDPILRQAIVDSTTKLGQPPDLAQRLIAWVEALIVGNEELSSREATRTRLERLMEVTVLPQEDAGGDE